MLRKVAFTMVDVFTSRRFGGNQLAVFTDAAALTPLEMQALAREMNFSESTFVTAAEVSGALRRVRIFTPQREIPMAGHPTVGTTWVLASRGNIALDSASVDAILQLGIGPVTVSIETADGKPAFVWMTHHAAELGAIRRDRVRIAKALGVSAADIRDDLPIQIASTGIPFIFVPLKTLDALARCAPNEAALGKLFKAGEPRLPIHMFVANASGEFGVRARMFAPHTDGIPEDPATGGAAAPFGAYAARHGLIDASGATFTISQGVEMGRPSDIRVEVRRRVDGSLGIRIGGRCAIVASGEFTLD
jgi:trans-2,3-dihydro-3-hydroxyanthranilate isomerase